MSTLDDILKRFDDESLGQPAADYAKRFLRAQVVERGCSLNTVRGYAVDLRAYLDWAQRAGEDPLKLSHKHFRHFVAGLDRAGYSKKTTNRRLSAVRTFFVFLNEQGLVDADPACAAIAPKTPRNLPRKVSVTDIDCLLSLCEHPKDAVGYRDGAFLELLYATGARIGELAELSVSDVEFSLGQVRLMGKGSKERIVPVHDEALAAVDAYLQNARPALIGGKPGNALFVSTRGNAMSADALRRVFKQRAAQAGLDPSMHPHDMRHSFATDLLDGGADLRSVQEMLGHANLSTTQIYTHLSMERMRSTMKQAHPRS